MRRRLSIPLIIMILVSLTVAGAGAITIVDAQGELCFYPKELTVQKGLETSVCPNWPFFDVKINITDVTKLSGLVVSVHWDCCFNCCKSDGKPGFTAGDFLPIGPPDATGWMITWDFPAKNMSEAANALLATGAVPPITISKPSWGWVTTLTFEYIGSPPSIGSPVDCYIYIMNQSDYAMTTAWCEDFGPYHNFNAQDPSKPEYVCTFHLHYFAQPLPVEPPTCCLSANATTITKYHPECNATVEFQGCCSKGGCDGDDYTVITAYEWELGDGTPKFNTTTHKVTHKYVWFGGPGTKVYTVRLVVYAPGIPPYIDPAYVPKSTECKVEVKVVCVPPTYIDVYTECERWPKPYICTDVIGEGPNMEADAYYPQEQVTLFAIVMYKGDIVQDKLVSFEIAGPTNDYYTIYFVRTARTNKYGIANVSFRIPHPCEHVEEIIFGRTETEQHRPWTVWATVMLGTHETETKYEDTLTFLVGWTVELHSAETFDVDTQDPTDTFKKCECIGVKLTIKNIAKTDRKAFISIVVYDDAGCVVARYVIWLTLKPTPIVMNVTKIICHLPVPKWAMVGTFGKVYANAYTSWPDMCGVPWCPEVSADITIEKGVCDP